MSLKCMDFFFLLLVVVVTFRGEKDIFRLVLCLTMAADLFLRLFLVVDLLSDLLLLFFNDCHRLGLDRS